MSNKKSMLFPFTITIIIIVIVIYLFANLEQSSIKCYKKTVDDLGIVFTENLETVLDGRNISELKLKRTIILPPKYLTDEKYLDYIQYTISKSYNYLDKDTVKVIKKPDRIVVYIDVKNDETLILNNIDFTYNNSLNISINSNTKSSDVVTLRINDNYTQGELISHMKNNGYNCG